MKKKIYLDSSAFSSLTCPRAFELMVRKGLVPLDGGLANNHKVQYGSAFHLFISHWYNTYDVDASIARAIKCYSQVSIPEKDFRTVGHLVSVCTAYLDTYGKSDWIEPIRLKSGKPFVEYTFKFVIYEDDELVIILFGKIDLVGKFKGKVIVTDHKTTAAYNPVEYLEGYQLSSQMMLYTWVLSKTAELIARNKRSVLSKDDMKLAESFRNPYAVIDGIFLQKPSIRNENNPPARFLRSEIIDYSSKRGMFWSLLCARINDIVRWEREGYSKDGMLNKSCDGKWGKPCMFHKACKQTAPEDEQAILDTEFNFLAYDEKRLEESE